MKIAVFGWYGHNNAGDERIKYCLESFLLGLGGIDRVDFFDLHEEAIAGSTNKFNDYDLVIIGGGGLILSQHNYHDFILGIQTKIVTLGISVETTLKGNPKKFSQALLEKSVAFLVRDEESYNKLKPYDFYNVLKRSYDLTFLNPYEAKKKSKKNKIGINLLAKPKNMGISNEVILFFSRFFKVASPKIIDFSDFMKSMRRAGDLVPIPLYCAEQRWGDLEHQLNDINLLKKYFDNVPESFCHEEIDECEVFVSMRLHGLIFAIQKGIPILTFSSYPKQINLMRDVGLKDYLIDINQLGSAEYKLDLAFKNFEIIKDRVREYANLARKKINLDLMEFLEKNF